jgi:hypothetical protein
MIFLRSFPLRRNLLLENEKTAQQGGFEGSREQLLNRGNWLEGAVTKSVLSV